MESPKPRQKRKLYFGMTGKQIGILAVMGALLCVLVVTGIVLVLNTSSPVEVSNLGNAQTTPTNKPVAVNVPTGPKVQCPYPKPSLAPPSQAECKVFREWYRQSESNISSLKNYVPKIKALDYNNLNISQIKQWSIDLEAMADIENNSPYYDDDYIADVYLTLYVSLHDPAAGFREFIFVDEREKQWGKEWAQEHIANGHRFINEGLSCTQLTLDYIDDRLAKCK